MVRELVEIRAVNTSLDQYANTLVFGACASILRASKTYCFLRCTMFWENPSRTLGVARSVDWWTQNDCNHVHQALLRCWSNNHSGLLRICLQRVKFNAVNSAFKINKLIFVHGFALGRKLRAPWSLELIPPSTSRRWDFYLPRVSKVSLFLGTRVKDGILDWKLHTLARVLRRSALLRVLGDARVWGFEVMSTIGW